MSKFKTGDKVKVVADETALRERQISDLSVIGKTGIVIDVWGSDGRDCYNVKTDDDAWSYYEQDLELVEPQQEPERTFVGHPGGGLEVKVVDTSALLPVSHKDYMSLSDAYDEHSRSLMNLKGEEYSIDGDFLAMENRLAGMLGDTPEYVSLVMAGKHITALGIILLKNDVDKIKLAKLDERIRDTTNLLKIAAAFVHAKQNDFSLHLGEDEKPDRTTPVEGGY